ncbi:hypothetical protein Pcaca04_23940 [Pectobacterium carotovorum subsp. carotovorum]|nr:hypothetical protein Pcaca04_23940 [Pectobacterium carotovorum subsp. carotovorum]
MAKIKILNNDNYTLIDDSFLNVSMQLKGDLSLSSDDEVYYQDVIYNANTDNYQPIIAVRCTSHKATVYRTLKSGKKFTFRILFADNDSGEHPSSAVGNYYIFDVQKDDYTGTGNLIVRNSTGKVVFDSDLKYMRVLSVNDFPAFKLNSQPRTEIANNPDKKLAAVCLNYGYYYEYSSSYEDVSNSYEIDIFYMYDAIIFKDASFVNKGYTFYAYTYSQISSGGAGSSTSIMGKYMIIDVTNY